MMCPLCGKEILVGDPVLHQVTEWVQVTTGVTALKRETGKMAHRWCVDEAERGLQRGTNQ